MTRRLLEEGKVVIRQQTFMWTLVLRHDENRDHFNLAKWIYSLLDEYIISDVEVPLPAEEHESSYEVKPLDLERSSQGNSDYVLLMSYLYISKCCYINIE